ncbi:LysM peptidoglycan-binding domain-containing protein [Spirochaetota bacterium]
MKKCISCLFLISISIVVLSGCDDKVPIRELTFAKVSINRAKTFKAEKYALKELKEAEDKLYISHIYIKKEKYEDAQKSAKTSKKMADIAYNKSIPLLAKDTIVVAEKNLNEAGEVYAEKLDKENFIKAKEKLKEANELFQNKKYYDSYIAAQTANKLAMDAKNVSLSKKNILKDSITEVKLTLENSRKYNVDKHSPEKYKLAMENLKIAEKAYDEQKLKKGFSAVEIAKINADEAYLISLKKTAENDLNNAQTAIKKAELSPGANSAKDELDASKESLQNAKTMYSKSRYKESISFSNESVKLAYVVIKTKKVTTDDVNVTKGEKDVKTGKDKDKDKKKVEYFTYKVKSYKKHGDCLWNIAAKFYKNGRLWKKIYNANKRKIRSANIIRPGWVLRIPKL